MKASTARPAVRRSALGVLLTIGSLVAGCGTDQISLSASQQPVPTRVLDVAYHQQEQAATCEVAALQMGLAKEGIRVTERQLLSLVGVDPRRSRDDAAGHIVRWGNPDQAFVGNPGGHAVNHDGYGVYSGPIARAARAAGGNVLASGTIPVSNAYEAILSGHPVVAWVTYDYAWHPLATYTAWDGTTVRYALQEHAVLLVGVGSQGVLINDPSWGRAWHSRESFEAAYATFGGMAVILD